MKTLQLNKIKYDVPTHWSEVTLEAQIKVTDDAENISGDTALKKIALISGYANIPIEILKETRMDKIRGMFKHLEFLSTPLPTKPISEFTFNDEEYTVMETLDKSQFQDWISLESVMENHKEHTHRALPYILAIIAKKKGETLDDFDVDKRAKEFLKLPMDIVEPLRVFFYGIVSTQQLNSLLSSPTGKEMLLNAKAIELKSILSKRDGLGWLRNLLRLMLLRLIKFYEKDWTKYFNSIRSKS